MNVSDAVARLRVLMGAPDDSHPDWPKVRHTISQILGEVQELTSHAPAASWLVSPLSQMVVAMPTNASELLSVTLTRGCRTDYPIFAALATQPAEQVAALGRKLQALYLVSVALGEDDIVHGEGDSAVRRAGLFCRQVVEGKYSSESLRAIVQSSTGPRSVLAQLQPLQDSAAPLSHDWKMLDKLLPFLRYACGERKPPKRPVGEQVNRRENRLTVYAVGDDEGSSPRKQALWVERPDKQTRADLQSEGLHPEYETTRETLYAEKPQSRNPDFPAENLTEYQAYQRLDLRARAFKSSQQQVPNRRETLFEPALAPLLHPPGPVAPSSNHDENWTLDTLLGFMLLTGCRAEELHDVRVWGLMGQIPRHFPAMGISLQHKQFIVPVPRLPESWRPDSAFRVHFRKPANRIKLKIPTHLPVGERIVSWASQRADDGLLCGESLGSTDQLCRMLEDRVSQLNEAHHTHLTVNRISLYLSNAVYALDGDMAEALLLSYRHRHSNDPRLYYHATQEKHLQYQYSRVWKEESKRPESDDTRRSQLAHLFNPDIGSAAVPHRDSICALVQAMRERVSGLMAGRGRRTASRWREIHNALTAYVICQIQWMTGIRAVRDLIELPLYAPTTGFLGVIDKDSNDEYGARVVWLIEPVQKQIQVYLQYVDLATRSILGKVEREAAFRFIGEGARILQVNQARLERFLPDYPFAVNSHRHHLRSRLREKGVDGGIVDAWMGHGGIGAEPYARHSAMSPVVMRDAAREALDSIWQELGWEVLPGGTG